MGRSPRLVSARARILGAVLVVAFVGLVGVGGVTFWAQRERVLAEIRAQLDDFADAVEADPTTDIDELIQTTVVDAVPTADEGSIALRDGEVVASSPTPPGLDLAADTRFVAAVTDATERTRATVDGDLGALRYVSVPVSDDAQVVHAVDLDVAMRPVTLSITTYTIAGAAMLLAIGIAGWFVTGRLFSPIRQLQATADSITLVDLGARSPEQGNDEISDLTRTVNSMLDRLEGSVDVQRQLLDDIRHELKTPITIVRGHLEVMDPRDPVDVGTTREITISELDRMTRLVDDIDLLAAVEGGWFETGIVDVGALTARVAELVAVIPDHDWALVTRTTARVQGDYNRLLQAWLQLADNAAKYTPAGSPIEIGSEIVGPDAESAEVRLWVRDHGEGIPASARHRIFRRFDRGHGRRSIGGSGLGLAIVEAIAKGHNGTCTVSDTPHGGATFTIHLPARTARPADLPAPVRAGDVVVQREATG